jgi:hypothetical protein
MRKNFTLLFLLGIFGLFTTNLFAQQDATIDPADIRYWIGEGENEVVFIVNWAEPDTALAWGFRFADEAVTIKDVMDGIAAADYRFSYDSPNGSWLNDIFFNDGVLDLSLTEPMWVSYLVNGNSSMETFDVQTLADGDYVKWGDTYCGTMVDPENWIYVWEAPVVAVYPLANEAMIDPESIRYWVGEGENEVIFAVNWNDPDTCLAWGYRFNEETVTVKHIMDAIKGADARFDYVDIGWGVGNIYYEDGVLDLSLYGTYWMYNVNGSMAMLGFDQQTVVDGDFIKWGDESCGTEIAPWTLVWESEVGAVYPYANEAKIEFSDILYWVGEGENEIVFAVNWNEPNRCLAWGYRFSEETVTVKEVMDAIAIADRRFSYVAGDWGVDDIIFNVDSEELHYDLAGQWWLFNVNGSMAMLGYDQQTLENGDFIKWGDESCATEIAQWSYVWTQEVEPVWMNTGVVENQTNTLSVYPNPAVNETFVTVENAGLNTISVYDIQGRMVSTESVEAMAGEQVRISTEMLNVGVYFVTVSNESAVRTAKLVVK